MLEAQVHLCIWIGKACRRGEHANKELVSNHNTLQVAHLWSSKVKLYKWDSWPCKCFLHTTWNLIRLQTTMGICTFGAAKWGTIQLHTCIFRSFALIDPHLHLRCCQLEKLATRRWLKSLTYSLMWTYIFKCSKCLQNHTSWFKLVFKVRLKNYSKYDMGTVGLQTCPRLLMTVSRCTTPTNVTSSWLRITTSLKMIAIWFFKYHILHLYSKQLTVSYFFFYS